MRGQNKKTIEEMEMEVAELIAKSGQCEQDILTNFKDYTVVKKQINNPWSLHNNENLQKMKDLNPTFLLCKSIIKNERKYKPHARLLRPMSLPPLPH